MTNKPIVQKIVLAGVVFNENGSILILQRRSDEDIYPNMWELPSGKREPLEPSIESLKREVFEESGLEIELVSALSVFDYQIEKENEIRDSTQVNFIVKAKNANVKLSEEHQAFAWLKPEELDNYNLSKETKAVIKQALNTYNKLVKE